MSREAAEHKAEYDRRYYREHRDAGIARLRAWRRTPIGRALNMLRNAEGRHRRKPSDRLAATIAVLEAEVARLRGVP